MAKPTKVFGPAVPPRRKSLSWDGSSRASSTFPRSHHLIITTAKGVFAWGSHGVKEIFRSGSEGIVAAKKAIDGSGLLAIADSQVVVLHDVNKGMQRSYRLKGSDGQVRLLKYGGDAKNLFFTTTLQNAVQSYSLNQSRLLDPSQPHPSPPTVFSLSPTSHLLLSASESPPLIYLTNLTLGTRPISIRPQCSSSIVVAANFHPERPNVFVLAFADGSAAVYDAVQLFHDKGTGERKSGPAGTGAGGEIASIKRLHAIGTWVSENEHSLENSGGTIGIGYKGLGITATAFVPGFKDTVITVGADGKCCIVDFAKRGARLVNTWHIRAAATSLAILSSISGSRSGSSQVDGSARSRSQSIADERLLVAIGRQDGKVVLFDLAGNLRGEHSIDSSGTRIIDMEWMNGDGTSEKSSTTSRRRKPGQGVPLASVRQSKRKSLGSLLAGGRPISEEVVNIIEDSGPRRPNISFDSSTSQNDLQARNHKVLPTGPALNHLDLFPPVKPVLGADAISRESSAKKARKIRGVSQRFQPPQNARPAELLSEDAHLWRRHTSSSRTSSAKARSHPVVLQRPPTRKGDQLAARRAATARLATKDMADPKVLDDPQSTTEKPAQPSKSLRLSPPYIKKNLHFEPQKLLVGASSNAALPEYPNKVGEPSEDLWMDMIDEPSLPKRGTSLEPSPATTKSYRTAHSYPSEASSDTIVTWSAGTSLQPAPSLCSEAPVPTVPHNVSKKRKKGHVSLTQSTESEDTTVQWSSFKRPPKAFYIREDPPVLKMVGKSQVPETAKPPVIYQIPPSIPGAFPVAMLPLGEASHNIRPPPSPAKSLQLDPPEKLAPERTHCLCLHDHESALKSFRSEIIALGDKTEARFERQRKWVEKKVVELAEAKLSLERENRSLREELARERRKGRGDV